MTEREEYVVELLKERNDTPTEISEITEDLNITHKAGLSLMQKLSKRFGEIRNINPKSKGAAYIWDNMPDKMPIPKPTDSRETHSPFLKNREKKYRNAEGYVDMTAGKAIENLEPKKDKINEDSIIPAPGEVWDCVEASGCNCYIYVIAYLNDAVQGVKIRNMEDVVMRIDPRYELVLGIKGETYIGDCSRFTFKPRKYLLNKVTHLGIALLQNTKRQLAMLFDMDINNQEMIPEKTQEKIIEKEIVEVPVPVERTQEIPEDCMLVTDAIINTVTRERDIWKQVAETLMERG